MTISPRQRQVLDGLWDGLSQKEISNRTGLAPNTVSKHLAKLRYKFKAQSTVHLYRLVLRKGMLQV